MKNKEIPQDGGFLEKVNIKELYYAVDDEGKYTTGISTGWSVKTEALNECLEFGEDRIAAAKELVIKGSKSPIVYYMEKSRMDWATLADYVGINSVIVRLHQYPFIFNKLSQNTLMKYAKAFNISLQELKSI
ncbi:MAG: hypothetical protein R2836_04310 [Chitinophagales bacterium]